MVDVFTRLWMRARQNWVFLLWSAAVIWTVVCELGATHPPITYRGDDFRLTFNSMMSHMLHGDFDVDPAIVGKEGFLRGGKVYAYWGIFPALLRIPLFLFPQAMHLDITRLAIIVAALLVLFFNYKLWSFVTQRFLGDGSWLSICLAGVFTFSGEQVCFLTPSLYQEVCFWALVFSSCFVYCAIRSLFEEDYARYGIIYMAIAASGALLTHVSMGIGLYLALLCFLIYFTYRTIFKFINGKKYALPILLAFLLSGLGILITAYVNYKRWGNPLTFANYDLYLMNSDFPSRLGRTKAYGLFNFKRFYLGVIYFFVPIWIIPTTGGKYLFQDNFVKMIDAIELPPSSFFLTDAFMFAAIFLTIIHMLKGKIFLAWKKPLIVFVSFSLAIPAFLMMIAISMNYRYRAEFYPDIVFMGVLGCIYINKYMNFSAKMRKIWTCLLLVSIVSSNAIGFLYKESVFGPAYLAIGKGVAHYYKHRFF